MIEQKDRVVGSRAGCLFEETMRLLGAPAQSDEHAREQIGFRSTSDPRADRHGYEQRRPPTDEKTYKKASGRDRCNHLSSLRRVRVVLDHRP
jgi:hypothetical protein